MSKKYKTTTITMISYLLVPRREKTYYNISYHEKIFVIGILISPIRIVIAFKSNMHRKNAHVALGLDSRKQISY